MKVSIFKRIFTAYMTIGTTFGIWFRPIITGMLFLILRIVVGLGRFVDQIFFPRAFKGPLKNPIMIAGNPRSGTTFMHRYVVKSGIGTGSQLWQMMYPSIILQKIIKPFLPLLEKMSPTRFHSSDAHAASLQSIETDDGATFFRYFDGFFLYGFILSWAEKNLYKWVDPSQRNMAERDYKWLKTLWLQNQYISGMDRTVGKLASIGGNLPQFLENFPDSKILYMVRDPLSSIPSALSLVTGALDRRFGFWNLPIEKRERYTNRLYNALLQLLLKFHEDWTNGLINDSRVFIVPFNRIMTDFDNLMNEILEFIDHPPSENLMKDIQETAEKQRNFQSKHKYDLGKFGLNEEQIKLDCAPIYQTFLNDRSDS